MSDVGDLDQVSRWRGAAIACLPRGRTLPFESWAVRHRAVIWLLLVHAGVLGPVTVAIDRPWQQALLNAGVPLLGAYAASRRGLSRSVRSCIAAVSLMLTSAVVVHLMNGSIEAHFHFFCMIPVVALYEDWVPFGLAVLVVLVHHGVMGTIDPKSVYDHPGAWKDPWEFAFIHAGFFAAACVGSIINWKLHENARDAESRLTATMRHQAHHDSLTGLPNRVSLLAHAHRVLGASESSRTCPVSVLLIDLDRFKDINDALGHKCGDELLAQVGPMLTTAIRERDIIARLGGDEFAAVLVDADEQAATMVAQRVLNVLTHTVRVGGVQLTVDASIGISSCDGNGQVDIDALLQQADIAMYAAKRSRSGHAVYRPDQESATVERLTLVSELRHAIDDGQIILHFQPKVSLTTGEVVGVEALARWQHPEHGLMSPDKFIPIAESTGLIVPLTMRVLDDALAQVSAWRQRGYPGLPVAVNLSPRCLHDPQLKDQITAMMAKHKVPAAMLELEITENSMASDPETALKTLTGLDAAGVRISIDDFGTGYSSMSYLRRLPVNELKVDRSFVLDLLRNPSDYVLVRSVIELGHNLGLTVVAEGVEDQQTLDILAAAGCDVAQGYHIGRPMPAADLCGWFEQRRVDAEKAVS